MNLRSSFLLAAVFCTAGCHDEAKDAKPTTAPAAIAVAVSPVRFEAVGVTVEVVGTLYGDDQVSIAAKVPGRVREIAKDVGDRVDEAGLLARIEPVDYELAVAQRESALSEALAKLGATSLPANDFDVAGVVTVVRARVQAENAKAKFERNRKLFEQQPPLLSEQDFADAQTAFEVAKRDADVAILLARTDVASARSRGADLEAAKQRLDDTLIRTPARDGQPPAVHRFSVAKRSVSVGSYVREGDILFELVADDPVKFRAAVPERFVQQIKLDQKLTVTVEGTALRAEGTIRRINPQIDIASRTFEVEGVIANPQRALRPGAFAHGSIVVGTEPQTLFVPEAAVYRFAGIDKIYSEADGKAVEHSITRGVVREGWVQVKEKLPKIERVITSNLGRLSNNAPIQLAPTTQPMR